MIQAGVNPLATEPGGGAEECAQKKVRTWGCLLLEEVVIEVLSNVLICNKISVMIRATISLPWMRQEGPSEVAVLGEATESCSNCAQCSNKAQFC